MVQGPVDYMINTPNAFVEGLKGYQMSQQMQMQAAAQAEQQAMLQRREQMKADLAAFANRQGKTKDDYERMMLMYPELEKQMSSSLERLDETQRTNKVNQMMPIMTALSGGNTDAAKEQMANLKRAYENSGRELEARNLDMLMQNVDIDPAAARTSMELMLFNADPKKFDKWSEAQKRFGEEKRAEQLQPGAIGKQRAEIIKAGVDMGLTRQEALRTAAQTKKLNAETQKIAMELTAMQKSGGIPPEKQFDQERKLAKEYQDNTKNFTQVQEAYRRIKAAENNAAGDLSLIFSYMKMLDPGSVVREGEFATAQNAAGVPDRVVNVYNRLLNGERLGSRQRSEFRGQSEKLMKAAAKRENDVRSGLEKVISNYGLNSENVFTTPTVSAEGQAQPVPEKEITRRGTYNGRPVVQYADGTIEYAD